LFILFVAVALLHLLPIWRVHLVPTVDGPSHVYNAVVLHELAAGNPALTRVFAVNLRPNPNWLGHALLFVALALFSPLVAEKLLLSLIVLLFLGGCWRVSRLIDPDNAAYAFLAMPLTFHLLLQMGFYNYSLGAALLLHAVAAWWQKRTIASPTVWLLLCALAHPLPAAAAMAFIGVAWLAVDRRWRLLLPLVAPALILGWFFLQPNPPGGHWTWKGALLWSALTHVMVLWTFDPRQLTFGAILGAVYAVLIIATLVMEKRQQRDVFLLLTVVAVILFLAAPVSVEEGFLLKARLLLFPYLLILPWLTPRLARLPLALLFAVVAIGNVAYIRDCWKRNEKVMTSAIAPLAAAAPGKTLLPLVFDHSSPYSHLGFLWHAVSYGAAELRLVDLGNYEAEQRYFPVMFRPGLHRPSILEIESSPGAIDVSAYARDVDYVFTWKMPPQSEAKLASAYTLLRADGDARLYARTATTTPPRAP
jgi:hypothetical protein